MKRFLQVFKFEFAGLVKGKWFRVSTVVICLLVSVVMFAPRFIDLNNTNKGGENTSSTTDHIGIYDPKGVFEEDAALKAAFPKAKFTSETSIDKLKEDVKKGTLQSGFYIKDYNSYEYLILDSSMTDTTGYILESIMKTQYQVKTLHDFGLTPEQINSSITASVKGDTTILGIDGKQSYYYTYILVFALYFVIMFYGQMIATNVASEKGNRSMEILVTSTSTNALIFGKVLAGAAASILQISVMLGVSMLAYQANIDLWNHSLDFILNIPANVLIAFAIFGTLGYLFYAFIYGVLGSMVSKVEEVSSAVTPVTIIFVIAFFVTFFGVMLNPGTLLSTIVSYVPFTSCMAMLARVSMGSIELWQVALSAVILALSTIGLGLVGAKLYRHGTLSYGNSFKFKHLLKLLKQRN